MLLLLIVVLMKKLKRPWWQICPSTAHSCKQLVDLQISVYVLHMRKTTIPRIIFLLWGGVFCSKCAAVFSINHKGGLHRPCPGSFPDGSCAQLDKLESGKCRFKALPDGRARNVVLSVHPVKLTKPPSPRMTTCPNRQFVQVKRTMTLRSTFLS